MGAGISEGNILQTKLVGAGGVGNQRAAILEEERFGIFQKFPYIGQLQALVVEGEEIVQYSGDPGRKGAGGGKI